jgi:hypothetical protein
MSTIVTRAGKGSPLTHVEVDANFTNLNTDKVEKTAAAITGGTINGTTIGATTPSSVNATTITGQTARLNGTGQNLLLQSGWAGGTSGTVGSGAVAPTSWSFGATGGTVTYASALSGSGNSIRFAATGSDRPYIQQSFTVVAGLTYSASFTVETVTSGSIPLNQLFLIGGTTSNTTTYFVNGSSATASTNATTGSKVQIVSIIGTISGTTTFRFGIGSSSATVGDITLANPQIEIGSTLGTYIPTTTTAVYGTPTLSFSGVSEIGLLSTGALYLQPAGTGALQAQATTSTTVGGNARGANAVDWQTARATAAQVASAQWSTISGGVSNTASATASNIGGGATNAVSNTFSGIFGGQNNTNTATYSFIGGGSSNTTGTNAYQNIVGGKSNTASGYFNFIGGGFTNSGTSGSAVTTQSGTMNGTTAVTLSGSNANIKVGQYITGTSIANDTYVAAISGTSLTLSQAASGSSTSTLSFFTPHGVVVGGGNNQATGSYSFIGGGGDAGTAANRNTASGDWSVVSGGWKNVASGEASFVGGGGSFGGGVAGNTASGTSSVICGGYTNQSSATSSTIGGGNNNMASGTRSTVVGGTYATTRGITANTILGTADRSIASSNGVSQAGLLVIAVETTDATATALRSTTAAAGTTNQVILPNNSAYFFTGEVVSGKTGGGDTKGWTIEGVIKRGANAASTALVGTPTVTSLYADAGAATWTIAVTADTTNGGLRVTFTGQASTTIRTVCQIRTTEMTY